MKSKFLSILVVLFVVCMSLTLFSACNNDNKPDSSGAGSSISDSSDNGGGTTDSSGNATDSSSNGGGVTVYSINLIVDGSVYAKISTKGNEIVNLPANPKKEGYVFDGWYLDNEVWKKPFTATSLLDTPLSSDMSVYAKWTAENHVATFKCDGKVVAEIFFTKESTSIKEPEVVKKDGYTAKWEEYELGAKDIIINAVYTPIRYTIKYIEGLGVKNDNPDSYTIESDDIVLKELSYDGVKFEGWYLNGEKIEKIAKGTFGNLELTAVWENREYKIEYELNGGKNNTANPISYTVDSNLIILQTPSKLGFDFKGWFTEVDFKSQVYAIPTGSMGDKKFYAKWQAIVYTIEYELNGGENNSTNPTTYTIESDDIVLQALSKTDYNFVGWYQTADFSDRIITTISLGSYGNKTLYAKWESKYFLFNNGTITGLTDYGKTCSEIVIPEKLYDITVTSIGDSAFRGCSRLTSITFTNSVTNIGNFAFAGCSNLIGITIPDSVTNIGNMAFEDCSSLTIISIPNSVISIGGRAFYNCSSLTSVAIPNSVTTIGNGAFYNCSSLTSVTIPDSVTSIGESAFGGCSNLTSMTIPFVGKSKSANEGYDQVFGYIFGYAMVSGNGQPTGSIFQYDSDEFSYYYFIPSSLRTVIITGGNISYHAFYNCSNLTSVTIPDSVKSIGEDAFV